MQLIDIIPNLTEENNELEYKGILNRDNTLSWLKTVDGFANAEGGVFYVGVEDKTLKLIGYDQKSLDGEKLFFHNELSNHFSIMPSYFIETIPYKINNSIRYIIKITINESSKKPLILRHQGMPMIYVRRDGFTSPATEEEIRNMVLNSDFPSFDK
ncbi:MAG: ATP-binding protein, partial [Bacillales bacterium]|nr:ATP-binding protein [Bacillales bacterium]